MGKTGFDAVEETGLRDADGGIDLILRNGRRILVQCKQWRRHSSASASCARCLNCWRSITPMRQRSFVLAHMNYAGRIEGDF